MNMRQTRRACLRPLAAGGGALLAACIPGGGPAATQPGSLPAATVEVWYNAWGGRTVPVMEGQIGPPFAARFPQIKLALVQKGGVAELVAAAAAGTPPSLVMLGAAQVVTSVRAGLALALDDRVKLWGQADDFFPAALNQARWKEKLWGMPAIAFANTYFWRRDLLEQEGIRQLPTTFEQSLDVARRLTRVDDGTVARQGIGLVELWAEFFMGMRGLGLPLARAGKAVFNGPEGLAMLQYQVDRAALTQPPQATPMAAVQNPLGQGRWAGAWGHYANIVNDARVGTPDTYRSVAVGQPLVPGGQQYRAPTGRTWRPATFSFHDWWLLVQAKQAGQATAPLDQTWEFLKHLESTEMLTAFNQPIGTLPPRKSAQGKGYLAEAQLREVADVYLRHGQPQYKYPLPQELNPGINNPLQAAIARRTPPKEALDEAARTWDTVMQREDFRDDIT